MRPPRRPRPRRVAALLAVAALTLTPAMAEAKTINGTVRNDHLTGTQQADKITGLAGNDVIKALGGADTVLSGPGNDTVDGGSGADTIKSDSGNDTITAGSGNDQVSTYTGDDRVDGGTGDDTIKTDVGNDILLGGPDNDRLIAYDGNDSLNGGTGDDYSFGGDGNDRVVDTSDGNNHLVGGPGDDRIYGGTGRNEFDGDEDDDFIDAGPGDASCPGVAESDTATGDNDCRIALPGAAGTKDSGNPGYITPNITADAGDDVVYPGDGVDLAFGEQGYDTFVLTDDGAYDRIFCDDRAQGDPLADPGQRGIVVYVSMSGDHVDPKDSIRNCEKADGTTNGSGVKMKTLTPKQFCTDDSLVYPDNGAHLPLPDPATFGTCEQVTSARTRAGALHLFGL